MRRRHRESGHHHGEEDEVTEVLEHELFEEFALHLQRRKHAKTFAFAFSIQEFEVEGAYMNFTMPAVNSAGQPSVVSVSVVPVKADGSPSLATLSGPSFSSSDSSVFSVQPDLAVPNSAGLTVTTKGAAGEAVLSVSATATEPDGVTTNTVTGSATISITAAPTAPAASLSLTFGTPA